MPKLLQVSLWTVALAALLAAQSSGPSYTLSTVAGTVSVGDGGPAANAVLLNPYGLVFDGSGNLYIADITANRIRKVDSAGMISTVAGTGAAGFSGDGGPGTAARLNAPNGLAVDGAGNVYIADTNNNRIRKLDTNGVITTVAGAGPAGYSGDGRKATQARLRSPYGVFVASSGALYVADSNNNRIRKVDSGGIIRTVAGSSRAGWRPEDEGSAAANAGLSFPTRIVVDDSGNLFIADTSNHRIRKVDKDGIITTYAGNCPPNLTRSEPIACTATPGYEGDGRPATQALMAFPYGLALDSKGNLFIADQSNSRVRRVDAASGVILTFAGGGFQSSGSAQLVALAGPTAVAFDGSGNLYIAESGRIRRVDANDLSVYTSVGGTRSRGDGGPAVEATLNNPRGVAVTSGGDVIIADTGNNLIRRVTASSGGIGAIAGSQFFGFAGDNGPATAARVAQPWCIAVSGNGNIYFADRFNNRVRLVNAAGEIHTVAGSGSGSAAGLSSQALGDGLDATSRYVRLTPACVAVDKTGNLYIADPIAHVIRKVDSNGLISTVVGNGTAGNDGDGGPATKARLNGPNGISIEGGGNLYIADTNNSVIRQVSPSGTILTIAGSFGERAGDGDGGPAYLARLSGPFGVAADDAGNVYIADTSNNRIRRIDAASGNISTIAGNASGVAGGDGGPATAALVLSPLSVAVDSAGAVYFTDSRGLVRKLTAQ